MLPEEGPWSVYRENIVKVVMQNNITGIGGQSFYQYAFITDVTIPDGLTSIGGQAFRNCDGLSSITIPAGVTEIGD